MAQDMATKNSRPVDVDREYVMMFSVTNEASSFMVRANLQQFMPGLPVLQYGSLLDSVPAFSANTNMHAINGELQLQIQPPSLQGRQSGGLW